VLGAAGAGAGGFVVAGAVVGFWGRGTVIVDPVVVVTAGGRVVAGAFVDVPEPVAVWRPGEVSPETVLFFVVGPVVARPAVDGFDAVRFDAAWGEAASLEGAPGRPATLTAPSATLSVTASGVPLAPVEAMAFEGFSTTANSLGPSMAVGKGVCLMAPPEGTGNAVARTVPPVVETSS
jgi:hypothetical protein